MNANLKKILDAVVLNEEISMATRLKVLKNLGAFAKELKAEAEFTDYLKAQTKTKSTVTNQLATTALEWLEENK